MNRVFSIPTNMRGFTLIEVMIAMMLALIGMLALGALTVTSMSLNTLARERVAAVNLGTRVMEKWIASPTDALPTPACNPAMGQLVVGANMICKPTSGEVNIQYTINAYFSDILAPIPPRPAGSPIPRILGPGLRITSLLVDRTNPSSIYAGTNGGGLFNSTNAGAAWLSVRGIGHIQVDTIVQDPADATKFYIGSDIGVLDNKGVGGTWRLLNTGLTNVKVHALAIDPLTANTLYAGTDGGVFRSTNGGTLWAASNGVAPNNLTSLVVHTLAIDPVTLNLLYAGTDGGVFKSTNGGTSWAVSNGTLLKHLPNSRVNALRIDPAVPVNVYVGMNAGIAQSTDSGVTWLSPSPTAVTYSMAMAANGTLISVISGTVDGVYVNGALKGVNSIATQAGLRTYSVAIDPAAVSSRWYAGTDDGVFKTTNGGTTWSPIGGNMTTPGNTPNNRGLGVLPKEKIVTVSWLDKGVSHQIVLTNITRRMY